MRGSTGESEPYVTKIRELEERLDNFRIQVSNDLTIRGNAWQGYALNAYTCGELGFGGPTPPGTGACCDDMGNCTVTTEADCTGTFQGVGTDCDPNPCVTTGRCALCKFCLGPDEMCDCGSGDYHCGYTCIDDLTLEECNAYSGSGYSTAWLMGGTCAGTSPCDAFEGGCNLGDTGACCAGGFCVDSFDEATCFGIGGIEWYRGCLCADCPPDCC